MKSFAAVVEWDPASRLYVGIPSIRGLRDDPESRKACLSWIASMN